MTYKKEIMFTLLVIVQFKTIDFLLKTYTQRVLFMLILHKNSGRLLAQETKRKIIYKKLPFLSTATEPTITRSVFVSEEKSKAVPK